MEFRTVRRCWRHGAILDRLPPPLARRGIVFRVLGRKNIATFSGARLLRRLGSVWRLKELGKHTDNGETNADKTPTKHTDNGESNAETHPPTLNKSENNTFRSRLP